MMTAAPGKIIILNGTSSSGKTSLLRALQNRMETEAWLDAGIDRFIWMMPRRYLNRPLWDRVLGLAASAGPEGHSLVNGMHAAAAALSRAGLNVLMDHVLVEPAWVGGCAQALAGLPAWLVGVRCPLDVLEQREADRKDRTLGQARLQFDRVHAHGIYDLEVDTSQLSPDEAAARVQAYVESGPPPQALQILRQRWSDEPLAFPPPLS
ncbi:MAG TPA: hypothetical protein PKW33_20570 [Anaerolineaceae bacterium]|nr:hypothetical protein [Anaerolineaceae bacterium]HPN54002.1 hypothetical protein [Anaerolineaceae bacterium]